MTGSEDLRAAPSPEPLGPEHVVSVATMTTDPTTDPTPDASNGVERRRWNDRRWTAIWVHRERFTSSVTEHLLAHLAPAAGERILDVGSGGGLATAAIAESVGPTGVAVGADVSVPLCELAYERAQQAGVPNASFVVADAQHDEIAGAPFDAAASQFGVMFFDDPRQAFANIRRHVAPGGRLAFVCWQSKEANPWFVGDALAPFVAPPPPALGKRPTGPFSLADPGETTQILAGAGWTDIERHPYEVVVTAERDAIADRDQLVVQGVGPEELDAAWNALQAAIAPLARPDGRYDAPLAFQVFTARA